MGEEGFVLPGHGCSLGEAAALADMASLFLIYLFFIYLFILFKKGFFLYGQKFSGLTDVKPGFALIRSKKDTDRKRIRSSLSLLADANPQILVLLKEGAISD